MTTELPPPVQAVVDAINRNDTDGFAACFTPDGAVEDHGRRFVGHDEIRRWSDGEATGAGAQMTPNEVTAPDGVDVVTVQATWSSQVFNGESTFAFTVAGDLVSELRIPSPYA